MKLHILSDLHNEFSHHKPSPASKAADVLVLAGDIWKHDIGIYWARTNWPKQEIIYVAGNHEFYGRNRKEVLSMLHIGAHKTGVHFLDDEEVIINGVRFVGATLWTDFELFNDKKNCMVEAQHNLSDFRVIYEGDRIFSPDDSVVNHEKSLAFLKSKLAEKFDGKTVVVTHHLPSMLSVAERFKENILSACYASNLDHLFGKSDLWIHGHTHDSFDYVVKGTRVICNPRGYAFRHLPDKSENIGFNADLIIEI